MCICEYVCVYIYTLTYVQMERQREKNRELGENNAKIVSMKVRSKRMQDKQEKKAKRSQNTSERKVITNICV